MLKAIVTKRFPPGPESAGFHLDVAFEAESGVTVLFGPSGSGKTLTLDALAGFVKPDTGRILLDDRILFDAGSSVNPAPRERSCGYVFQSSALFPHMTLRENLAFAARSLPRLERHRRIAEQLDRFALTAMAGRYPRELSGGQQQRGSIARALIANPKMILLDEPASGLDAALREDLHGLIRELRDSLRIPILLVTHDFGECLSLGTRVLIYEAGRILHRGAPCELMRNPGTAGIARLMGGFNIYEAEVLALDPGKQTSRVRLLGAEMTGPFLRACLKGDRVGLCARPEELRVRTAPGDNRIRAMLRRTMERPQSVRADFGDDLVADLPREEWRGLAEAEGRSPLWVEIPPDSMRQIALS